MTSHKYPDDQIQHFVCPNDDWWLEDSSHPIIRGRLLWAYLPHVDVVPVELIAEGRPGADPTDHTHAEIQLRQLRISAPGKLPILPIAGLPHYESERRLAYRAKRRPSLIVSCGGAPVDKSLRGGAQAKWTTAPTILVAPFYGVEANGTRGGWGLTLVDRIKKCEYPQYFCDSLPPRYDSESILRLDHIQPLGNHHDSYELTPFRLCDDAMLVLQEWLDWVVTGVLDEKSVLEVFRSDRLGTGNTISKGT